MQKVRGIPRARGMFWRGTTLAFLLLGTLLFLSPRIVESGAGRNAQSPNIVVIMADDLDVQTLWHLVRSGLMPKLQGHIIRQGTTFTSAFVTNPACCPSRATFLTGQYPHNHTVLSNVPPDGSVLRFDDSSTLATWLQAGGYRTGYVGKYLSAYGAVDLTGDGVVDEQDALYIPPGWEDWRVLLEPAVHSMYGYTLNVNGRLQEFGDEANEYQTDVIAGLATEFLREAATSADGRPFFLAVMPTAPHVEARITDPVEDYNEYWEFSIRPAPRHQNVLIPSPPRKPSYNEIDVSDKPLWLRERPLMRARESLYNDRKIRRRMASLLALDDLIGDIVIALWQSNRINDTVLLFTSDSGYMLGEHRLSEKAYPYEEAIRVPLFIRAPGLARGQVVAQPVLNNDLAPTLADFAGATPTHVVDGVSLRPLMENPQLHPWRKRFLVEYWYSSGHLYDAPPFLAVRTGMDAHPVANQVFVQYWDEGFSREFYDLAVDPYQMDSLHDSADALRQQQMMHHHYWLSALMRCGNGSCQSLEFAIR
jgi:N-acetylglucosamine-6-sulfatase